MVTAEYRQGLIPGSPELDQLRANANMANAPSRIGVDGTWGVLFTSDVGAVRDTQIPETAQPQKGLTGVGNAGAAAVSTHASVQWDWH